MNSYSSVKVTWRRLIGIGAIRIDVDDIVSIILDFRLHEAIHDGSLCDDLKIPNALDDLDDVKLLFQSVLSVFVEPP